MIATNVVNSPYDASTPNVEAGSLELADVIKEAQRALSLRLRVALPAKIVAVDGDQAVQVQPLLQSRYKFQNQPVDLPVVAGVPVLMPRGANYSIRLPVAVGDTGLLVFCDRSLDNWLADTNGGRDTVDPQDSRAHDLNDAIFVPGITPFPAQTTDGTTDLVITNGNAQMRLLANGTVKLGSIATGGFELLAVLDRLLANQVSLINALATQAFVLTQLGPQPFIASTQAALQQLQSTASEIQANLDSIKVST